MTAFVFNIQRFSLHDGAGIRTDVFFQGCNLRCKWCANPESQSLTPPQNGSVRAYTVNELVSELIKDKPFYDKSGGGVTLTGGEALLYPDFVCELCNSLLKAGIQTALETAANVREDVFARVISKCAFLHVDLKHWNNEKHKEGTGTGNEQILRNIAFAQSTHIPMVVRIPIIPGFNDSMEDAEGFLQVLTTLKIKNVQLLPFHQLGESKYQQLGLQYAYAGVNQLHDEDIIPYAKVLQTGNVKVQIGG